jgi:hypothetical protein
MDVLKHINRISSKKIAVVMFSRGTMCYFKTTLDDLEENDMVLVHTKQGYEIAHFYEYTTYEFDVEKAIHWIVQKIDTTEYEENKKLFEEDNNVNN